LREIYKMNLIKLLLFSLSFFYFSFNFAQTAEGEIIISEESIQSLANKLYALKVKRNSIKNTSTNTTPNTIDIKYLNELIESDTLYIETLQKRIQENMIVDVYEEERTLKSDSLIEITEKVDSKKVNDQNNQVSDEESNQDLQKVLEKLVSIENQLIELKRNNRDTVVEFKQSKTDTVLEKQTETVERIIEKEPQIQELNNAELIALQIAQNQRLKKANTKIDSLLSIMYSTKPDTLNFQETKTVFAKSDTLTNQELVSLKNQIYLLHAKLDRVLDEKIETKTNEIIERASKSTDTIYVKETKEVNPNEDAYEARKLKFGDYFEQIYFANNSSQVASTFNPLISNLVTQLKNEPKIDVSIAGYASKTGNADYNQKISMQRALALKTKLIAEGISPKRIITDFQGIDYNAASLEEARRLDIEFIIRK